MHTPVPFRRVSGRPQYWQTYDRVYYDAHPNARRVPVEQCAHWELPHWIPWLGGIIAEEFPDQVVLDFYARRATLNGIDESGIIADLSNCPADAYLFSPMTLNLPYALWIAGVIKQLYPTARTVFGGTTATPLANELAADPRVDVVVAGRGETVLLDVLRGETGPVVSGRFTMDVSFPNLKPLEPWPDLRYIRLVYGLGCRYRCDFCTIQTIARRPSFFPVERVLTELALYHSHFGHDLHVYFGDETFTQDVDALTRLLPALRDAGVDYDCQTRMSCLTDPRLPELLSWGCRWLEIGLETANPDTLARYKQRSALVPEDLLARYRDAGVPVCAYVGVGFPGETSSQMRASLDAVAELITRGLLRAAFLSVIVPYPGTRFYTHPERYGMRILHHNYELYHEELLPVFETDAAKPDEVYAAFLHGVRIFTEAVNGRF